MRQIMVSCLGYLVLVLVLVCVGRVVVVVEGVPVPLTLTLAEGGVRVKMAVEEKALQQMGTTLKEVEEGRLVVVKNTKGKSSSEVVLEDGRRFPIHYRASVSIYNMIALRTVDGRDWLFSRANYTNSSINDLLDDPTLKPMEVPLSWSLPPPLPPDPLHVSLTSGHTSSTITVNEKERQSGRVGVLCANGGAGKGRVVMFLVWLEKGECSNVFGVVVYGGGWRRENVVMVLVWLWCECGWRRESVVMVLVWLCLPSHPSLSPTLSHPSLSLSHSHPSHLPSLSHPSRSRSLPSRLPSLPSRSPSLNSTSSASSHRSSYINVLVPPVSGCYLRVINRYTGLVTFARHYPTLGHLFDLEVTRDLEVLREGRLALLTSHYDASGQMGNHARLYLSSRGSWAVPFLKFRDAWAWAWVVGEGGVGEALVTNPASIYSFPSPLVLHLTLPPPNPTARHCEDWPEGESWQKRRYFCDLYDGYGDLCSCSNPYLVPKHTDFASPSTKPTWWRERLGFVVVAGNRPRYLYRLLGQLLGQPGVTREQVLVSVDGPREETLMLCQVLQLKHVVHQPEGTQLSPRISRSVRFALYSSLRLEVDKVVVLEEDLILAPDFHSYMQQTSILLDEEADSIYAVSAFNHFSSVNTSIITTTTTTTNNNDNDMTTTTDNYSPTTTSTNTTNTNTNKMTTSTYTNNNTTISSRDPLQSGLQRATTFPSCGWMTSRAFIIETLPKWPPAIVVRGGVGLGQGQTREYVGRTGMGTDWDYWMGTDVVREGRELVVPLIPRTAHGGAEGSHSGGSSITRWFSEMPLSQSYHTQLDIDAVRKDAYEETIKRELREGRPLNLSDPYNIHIPMDQGVAVWIARVRMIHVEDSAAFRILAQAMSLWCGDARGHHHGLWRLHYHSILVVVVGVPYSRYSSLVGGTRGGVLHSTRVLKAALQTPEDQLEDFKFKGHHHLDHLHILGLGGT
ncbi:hypothetical protein Pcinc_005422 [Petrolisthes cinctipes]|uniref:ILEI/PANDER domain-containing protein n=1 Tax=Petrolisthes cinctipes TaxID=88211 RepID=A0AAE1GF33_PETCI|nr:hypothetical protein Pcinc_005422 [Petrolisthes cinctipes]